nr:MAG: lipopolysaccharide transport periplasmic protein LptA [Pseudomonadota bacterium]
MLAGLVLALAATAGSAAEPVGSGKPISLDAARTTFDYRANTVVFDDIVISQEGTRIAAKRAEASGLDFENSRWVFQGDVRITVDGRGSLSSDRAVVEFRDNRIERAEITGSPAHFEQKLAASQQTARGRAGTIEYSFGGGTVRLSQDAWLSDGRQEFKAPLIVYDIRKEQVQAASEPGADERVRITILPREKEAAEKKEAAERGAAEDAKP